MSNLATALNELIGSAGVVESVSELRDPDLAFPIGFSIAFREGELRLAADPENDTILVADAARWKAGGFEGCSLRAALPLLIGARLSEAWTMTNHQGYEDGVQLGFRDRSGASIVLQFVVAASMIRPALLKSLAPATGE